MKVIIQGIFDFLAVAFDKIPALNKLKGYRSVLGLIGLAVITILKMKGIGDPELLSYIDIGLLGWTALALNATGRE